MKKTIGGAVVAVAIALAAGLAPAMAAAGPLQTLPGRWSGWGNIIFDGGSTEQIKCIATYFVNGGGKSLQQNLRCTTSSSYKISARSDLAVAGNSLSGKWVERKTGKEGSVSGRMTDGGFRLSVTGPTFKAAMRVDTSDCQQSINIAPSGLGVKNISIKLGNGKRC